MDEASVSGGVKRQGISVLRSAVAERLAAAVAAAALLWGVALWAMGWI